MNGPRLARHLPLRTPGLPVVLAVLVVLAAAAAALPSGRLESGFGHRGLVTLGPGEIRGVTADRTGGVVAVGYSGRNMLVVHLTRTGAHKAPLAVGQGVANAVAIQADGKILVAGTTAPAGAPNELFSGAANGQMVLKRFNADGSPDRAFGSGGTARAPGAVAQAIALGSNGTIIIAGFAIGSDTTPKAAIVRFRPNGTPDNTFGINGFTELDFGPITQANAVAVQRDGKIVFAGDRRTPDLRITNALIVRLSSSGQLDPSFGGRGTYFDPNLGGGGVYIYHSHGGAAASFKGVAIDSAGRILGAGGDVQNSGEHALFTRLSPQGALDPSFGSGGVLTTPSTHDSNRAEITECCAKSIAIAGGGEIVAAGDYMNGSVAEAALWALRSSGRMDPRVGPGGVFRLGFPTNLGGESLAVAVAPDGSLYSGGEEIQLRGSRRGTTRATQGFVARLRDFGPLPRR